jgi:hypothetical protein
MQREKLVPGKQAMIPFIVHASKGDKEMTTFRLSVVAAAARAQALANAGWEVSITDPDGTPFKLDELALSRYAVC